MTEKLYKQCSLTQGKRTHTAWIPENLAVEGKMLVIEDKEKQWHVDRVFDSLKLPHSKIVEMNQQQHKGVFDSLKKDK